MRRAATPGTNTKKPLAVVYGLLKRAASESSRGCSLIGVLEGLLADDVVDSLFTAIADCFLVFFKTCEDPAFASDDVTAVRFDVC